MQYSDVTRIDHNIDRADFAKSLLCWWTNNKRDFPWRLSSAPYQILVAEVLLHRTRAGQVVPVYLEFLELFPSIDVLSQAPLNQVKDVVYKLGLHWRTELLHNMAQEIMKRFEGKIPQNKDDLKSLPGVSDYIASAMRIFAFNKSDALLDTNIVRILGRVFDLTITDSSRRNSRFQKLYEAIGTTENPREFAFAMIDLASLICLPRNPKCSECPLCMLCRFASKSHARCSKQT
jgi:A/G-specific adenine glycosylase